MNRCKDCKHFSRRKRTAYDATEKKHKVIGHKNYGFCQRITDCNDPEQDGEAFSWDYEGYSAGLDVNENFGCILFESITKICAEDSPECGA